MTGYHPDHSFLTKMGVQIDEETGRPIYTEDRMETNAENIFIAGVIALEIMQMKYLSRTEDFMEMRLRKPLHQEKIKGAVGKTSTAPFIRA